MTKKKLDEAVAEIKEKLGDHLVGVITTAVESDGQIGFAVDEDDEGPDVRGKWLDMFESVLSAHGVSRCRTMPFPVSGKLVYVIAGLKSLKDEEDAQ